MPQILNDQQIAQLAYDAGFRGDQIRWAVAIAKAESGGNPAAYNPEIAAGTVPGSGSRGLWQIYGTAHPQYNNDLAFDPVVNSQAAFKVFREAGGKFTPWSTFNNGMAGGIVNTLRINTPSKPGQRGRDRNTGSGLQGGTPEQPTMANRLDQTNQAVQNIASGEFVSNALGKIFTPENNINFAFTVGGMVLILIGLIVILAKPTIAIAKEVI